MYVNDSGYYIYNIILENYSQVNSLILGQSIFDFLVANKAFIGTEFK